MPETSPANLASSSSFSSSDRASVKTEEIEAGGVGSGVVNGSQEVESEPETAAASSIAVNAFPESSSGIFLSCTFSSGRIGWKQFRLKVQSFLLSVWLLCGFQVVVIKAYLDNGRCRWIDLQATIGLNHHHRHHHHHH